MYEYKNTATFVIPHFSEKEDKLNILYLKEAIDGLFKQSDQNWRAIIIDDKSRDPLTLSFLANIKKEYYPKLDVIFMSENVGPGVCRNIGILYAQKNNSPIILFNDSDDISHPYRLEIVRNIFESDRFIGLIYSTFNVINTQRTLVENEKIPIPIQEILKTHEADIVVEGYNTWIKMATESGYINKTSSTAVRTKFAIRCFFPAEYASEDYHTWLRLSAMGVKFKFAPGIPTFYRIPTGESQQASRIRIGAHEFNKIKIRVDADGFEKAVEIALAKDSIMPENVYMLKAKFFKRQADFMKNFGENELSNLMLNKYFLYLKLNEYYSANGVVTA
ncbi:MAG: hypothetical protein A3F17_08070 [Gammaproteobacteria bacterium RIFCSPHIGHO2_12_FULL_41_15]|nr:MAG: hypothetical protein A3F17_08070 [Gammaproteobacteria bacterium RIFCSPHIGHO2_12_FULL_41_15]